MTFNRDLLDAEVRHQIYLLRYSKGLVTRLTSILAKSDGAVAALLTALLAATSSTEGARYAAAEIAIAKAARERADVWKALRELLLQELVALPAAELATFSAIITTVSPVLLDLQFPAAAQLRAVVVARPFQGMLLKEWVSALEADDARRLDLVVRAGVLEGISAAEIVRRFLGSAGEAGVSPLTAHQLETVVLTAVQHIASVSRDLFVQANKDLVTIERFVATLDAKTTARCRALDGKTFRRGFGPRPPLHMRCRSLRVPTASPDEMARRPAVPVVEKRLLKEFADREGLTGTFSTRADLPHGTRGRFDSFLRKRIRELVGTVPASETYQQWLRRQSREFQEDVLGVAKAKLFRDGGLTLDRFVARDGSELTLAELSRRHASAFRAAGLDPAAFH